MMEKKHSAKFLRQRKMALLMPVMVLPFLFLFIFALGNLASGKEAEVPAEKKGVNMNLPEAQVKAATANGKLGFYDRAAEDSLKLKGSLKEDPYMNPLSDSNYDQGSYSHTTPPYQPYQTSIAGSSEMKVYNRLNELNTAINSPDIQRASPGLYAGGTGQTPAAANAEVQRLENMMLAMKSGESNEDAEMLQINGMLESILDIQHPERVQQKLKKASQKNRGQVFPVTTTAKKQMSILDLQTKDTGSKSKPAVKEELNAFYSDDQPEADELSQNAIEAVVHEQQQVTEGSTVKLRLRHEVYINGTLIPRGTLLTGIAGLSGERLQVKISAIRYKSNLFPINLETYDMDGIAGIRIRGVTGTDVAKGTADQTVSGIGMNSFDPSLGAQAASAGIEISKRLLSRKIKTVKVNLTAGYHVLLFDKRKDEQ